MASAVRAILGTLGALNSLRNNNSSSSSSGAPSWLGLDSSGQVVRGSGTSARGVSNTSGVASGSAAKYNDLSGAIAQVTGLAQSNSAWNAQQAALQRDWAADQARIARDYNSAEAAKNREWQEMMSNTAHQREIRDLQAAGLNPVLSAMGGNGAAVTSGATAASSGAGAGAHAQADSSVTQGLVNLIGTMWSAQTQLESQRLSAQNNLAIAEKQNATSELVARLYTEQAREASQLAAETGLSQAAISAAASRAMASIAASASRYGSDMSYSQSQLATEANKEIAKLNLHGENARNFFNGFVDLVQSGLQTWSSIRGQNKSAQSALDVAKEHHKDSFYGNVSNTADAIAEARDSFLGFLGFGSGRRKR